MFSNILNFLLIITYNIYKVTATECCDPQYSNYHTSVSVSDSVVNYTLYDLTGNMRRVWAFEVDESGKVLTNKTMFDSNTSTFLCPAGYQSGIAEDQGLRSWCTTPMEKNDCKMLCLQPEPKFQPDKWYVNCRENSCQSCSLDRMVNEEQKSNFVKVTASSIVNETFIVHLLVLAPSMRYNVSIMTDHAQLLPSMLNLTVESNQSNIIIKLQSVNQKIKENENILMRIVPWPKIDSLQCELDPGVQYIKFLQTDLRGREDVALF